MIRINDEEISWTTGMTVRDAMNQVKYTFPLVVVSVNGKVLQQEKLDTYILNDGDEIMVIHLTSGG